MYEQKPIAIYYEHPEWFAPLFAELDRRGTPYVRLDAATHMWDPSEQETPYAAVVNRVSLSAHLRGNIQTTFHTLYWFKHLERLHVPIVNGSSAYMIALSKALQLDLLQSLGLPYPHTRIINHASQACRAAENLRFPVLVKANIGGSGAGIQQFDTSEALASAALEGKIDFGVDHTALVQEYVPLSEGRITRIEVLDGKLLYALNVYPKTDSFDLCPADALKNDIRVESAQPPLAIIDAVKRITKYAALDVGGIEFLIDSRDGLPYIYDINALSNFVVNAPDLIGFDPFERFVDYIEMRAGIRTNERENVA